MNMKLELIKQSLGKDWKFLLIFLGISILNLILNYWIVNLIGFFSSLMMIGYISLGTSKITQKQVLKVADSFRGLKDE